MYIYRVNPDLFPPPPSLKTQPTVFLSRAATHRGREAAGYGGRDGVVAICVYRKIYTYVYE